MNNIKMFRDSIDEKLKRYLPTVASKHHEEVLEAMKYSFAIGGKRIRPLLMYGAFKMVDGSYEEYHCVEVFMACIEMIHTYSLIHDDLPAMDNDDLRRGKPTCHKVYGEANAVLAGDGLLNYAYELALKETINVGTKDIDRSKKLLEAMSIMASHAGIYGMIGGQAADIKFESKEMTTKNELDYIHKNKTGALIRVSLIIGGILGGGSVKQIEQLKVIGNNIGLSFQIQDDLLDKYSTKEVLGKPIGSDEKNNKKTYVSFVGVEQSKEDVKRLLNESRLQVEGFNGDSTLMLELIDFLETRKY